MELIAGDLRVMPRSPLEESHVAALDSNASADRDAADQQQGAKK